MQIEGDRQGPAQSKATASPMDCGKRILVFKRRQPTGVPVRQDGTEVGESHQEIRDGYLPAVPQ